MPHLHNVLLKLGYHLLGSPFLFKNISVDFQYFTNFLAIILKIFYKTLDLYLFLPVHLYHKTTTNNIMTITKLKQIGYGNIEVDNTEKDIIQIWYFEQDESNVVQLRRENLKHLITALIACDKDEFTIMQYVRLYAYKPLKDIALDLGITRDELKNIMDKFGTTISEMRGNLDAFKSLRKRKNK